MHSLSRALEPTCRMLLYAAGSLRIELVGDMERSWIAGAPPHWGAVVRLFERGMADPGLPLRIMAGEERFPGLSIAPIRLVPHLRRRYRAAASDRSRRAKARRLAAPASPLAQPAAPADPRYAAWQRQLGLDGPEDPPLQFVQIALSGHPDRLLLPLEAFAEWGGDWEKVQGDWRRDRRRVLPWISFAHSVPRLVGIMSARPLRQLEREARRIDRLAPHAPETLTARLSLELHIARAGLLGPEDGGTLVQELVGQRLVGLAGYREAALALAAHAPAIPGASLPGYPHPLASPVSLQWFRLGPFHSQTMDVVSFLSFGMRTHMDRDTLPAEPGSLWVSQSTGHSGRFYVMPGPAGLAQIYASDLRAGDGPEQERLELVAALAAKAGHPRFARLIAALALRAAPERAQPWIELGMTFWYEGRRDLAAACLQRAARYPCSYGQRRFIAEQLAEGPPPAALPERPAEQALADLAGAADAFLAMPLANQLGAIWLRSATADPALAPLWEALIDRLAPGSYLGRAILRALSPRGRRAYLARQPEGRRATLAAHCLR